MTKAWLQDNNLPDLQDPIAILIELYHNALSKVTTSPSGREAKGPAIICYRIFYRLMQALSDRAWSLDAGW